MERVSNPDGRAGPGYMTGGQDVRRGSGGGGEDETSGASGRRRGRVEGCGGGLLAGALLGAAIAVIAMTAAGACFES